MTRITDEMREAIKAELFCTCDWCVASAEASYLAMFALDPEVVGMRAELAALRENYKAITEDAVSGVETVQSVEHYYEEALDRRESELAVLRPVVKAAKARRDVLNTVFDTGHAAAEALVAAEERLDQTVAVLGNEGETK